MFVDKQIFSNDLKLRPKILKEFYTKINIHAHNLKNNYISVAKKKKKGICMYLKKRLSFTDTTSYHLL